MRFRCRPTCERPRMRLPIPIIVAAVAVALSGCSGTQAQPQQSPASEVTQAKVSTEPVFLWSMASADDSLTGSVLGEFHPGDVSLAPYRDDMLRRGSIGA